MLGSMSACTTQGCLEEDAGSDQSCGIDLAPPTAQSNANTQPGTCTFINAWRYEICFIPYQENNEASLLRLFLPG